MDDALRAALDAASILDEMGVRWFLGGSLASSVHGIPRATFDADIMADLRPLRANELRIVGFLAPAWSRPSAASGS